ncbi:MAG TPA: ABC transporter permease [Vicinamibacterales bacterium]|nr:ABC transporter permease [Vicinamibacterales bacterium]
MADGKRASVLDLVGPFAGLIAVAALFAVLEPATFLSVYNLQTIAAQTVIVGLGAIGMTFVIVSGGIDLSVGSAIALSSVVTALALREGWNPAIAALAGAAAGLAIGIANGIVIARAKVVPFIVTLGTMGVARGVAKYLAGEQKIDAPPGWLAEVMARTPEPAWLIVAPGVWMLAILAVAMGIVLTRTVFGLHTYAIGSSEPTAHLSGVRVARTKTLIYAVSGLFAGLAGVVQYARLTVGDPTTAVGKELDVIAAVVIGGASLSGGVGGITGSLVGAFLMTVLANGCTLTGVPNYVQEILIGLIIVVAVAVDRLRHRQA